MAQPVAAMMSRAARRAASRRAARPQFLSQVLGPAIARASFTSSAKVFEPEVPVVSYSKGERQQSTVQFEAGASGPVTPPGADDVKVAMPLKPEVSKNLTPTLKKFTLEGKVAVVTG